MTRQIVLLIHGVGNAKAGELLAAVRTHSSELGPSTELHEFHWNSLLDALGHVGDQPYVSGLIRGLIASCLGDDVSRAQKVIRLLLLQMMSFALILAIWGGLLGVDRLSDGAPERWRPALFPLGALTIPALLLFPSLFSHSSQIWLAAVRFWCIGTAALGGLYGAAGCLRGSRGLVEAVRTVVLITVWPFVWIARYSIVGSLILVIPCVLFAVIGASIGVHGCSSQVVAPDPALFAHNWDKVLLAIFAIGSAALIALLLGFGLDPLFKVLTDIFRYTGDRAYRELIQQGFAHRLEELGDLGNAEVYLVGHSLGSVIAVHALTSPNSKLKASCSVTLITLGSPLYRFFSRFFRSAVPSPDELSFHLHAHYQRFRWLNVYRPLDPIGTRIFRKPHVSAVEASTGQRQRIFIKAHTNYWEDSVVLKTIKEQLDRASCDHSRRAVELERDALFAASCNEMPSIISIVMAVIVVFGTIVLTFVDSFMAYRLEVEDYRRLQRTVEADPVYVVATVGRRPVAHPSGNGLANRSYESYVTFRTGPGDPPCNNPDCHQVSLCEQDVDSGMADYLEAQHGNQPNIRYRRGAPKLYYAPGYEPSPPTVLRYIFGAIWDLILAGIWVWIAFKYLEVPVSTWLGKSRSSYL